MLIPGSGKLPLIDRDEPRFTEATHEMLQRHDFIIPYFNGEYRFDKPVMTYWLMMGSFSLFGNQQELAARFHSILASILVAFCIYEFARSWLTISAGILGGIIWLTSLQILIHGRVAVADMPMILAVAFCHLALFKLITTERKRFGFWFWALYLGLAFGFLVKGPVALACPILTMILFYLLLWWKTPESIPVTSVTLMTRFSKKFHFNLKVIPFNMGRFQILSGSILCLLMVAAWGVPALIQTHGAFWKHGMQEHVIDRGMESFNNRIFLPYYYFLTIFGSLFPWSAFLAGIYYLLKKEWNQTNAFLLAWAAAPYIIFSFYQTQLPHYVLPAFPALALLLAQSFRQPLSRAEWVNVTLLFVATLLVAGTLLLIAGVETFPEKQLPVRDILPLLGGFILMMFAGALLVRVRGLSIAAVVFFIAGGAVVWPVAENVREIAPVVGLTDSFRHMPQGTEYLDYGFAEPTLTYYSGGIWKHLETAPDSEKITSPGPRFFVFQRSESRVEDYVKGRLYSKPIPDGKDYLSPENQQLLIDSGYQSVRVWGVNTARVSWVELDGWFKRQ